MSAGHWIDLCFHRLMQSQLAPSVNSSSFLSRRAMPSTKTAIDRRTPDEYCASAWLQEALSELWVSLRLQAQRPNGRRIVDGMCHTSEFLSDDKPRQKFLVAFVRPCQFVYGRLLRTPLIHLVGAVPRRFGTSPP
jgi:hypothetical protein